jgi:hypothetical protein
MVETYHQGLFDVDGICCGIEQIVTSKNHLEKDPVLSVVVSQFLANNYSVTQFQCLHETG